LARSTDGGIARLIVPGRQNISIPMTILIVQRYTSDRLRGRAFTVIISIHSALLGLAMVASGALTELVGPRWTYAAAACCTAGSAIVVIALRRGFSARPALTHRAAA